MDIASRLKDPSQAGVTRSELQEQFLTPQRSDIKCHDGSESLRKGKWGRLQKRGAGQPLYTRSPPGRWLAASSGPRERAPKPALS